MKQKLAIRGGTRLVPEGTIKKWPPVDETDRRLVLEALAADNHATFSTNCYAFKTSLRPGMQ